MSSIATLFSRESSSERIVCSSDYRVAKVESIFTLALLVKFLVSDFRFVSTISRRFGLEMVNISLIKSPLDGSFDSRIAIVCLRVFSLLEVFHEGIRVWIALSSSSRWILVSSREIISLLFSDSSIEFIIVDLMELAASLW